MVDIAWFDPWLTVGVLTDQTAADGLTLASMDCTLPMALVFKGVERSAQ